MLKEAIDSEVSEALSNLGLRTLQEDTPDTDLDFEELYSRFECGKDFDFSVTLPLQTSFTNQKQDSEVQA